MTTIASLLYASPAWWRYTSAADRSKLERLVARLRRGGNLPADHPFSENLAMIADQRLYRSIIHNPYHVLRRFFLEKVPTGHNLRPRAHNFVQPIKDNNNFVTPNFVKRTGDLGSESASEFIVWVFTYSKV